MNFSITKLDISDFAQYRSQAAFCGSLHLLLLNKFFKTVILNRDTNIKFHNIRPTTV